MDSRKKIIIGTSLVVFAFICVTAIFYALVNSQTKKSQEIDSLQERLAALDTQTGLKESKIQELESKLGQSVYLENIMKAANQRYSPEERNNREGRLWVDRKAKTMIATLGVINGVLPGSRLAVYNDNQRIGYVTVETPMDVISYIEPADLLFSQYDKDYFRVVIEQ